MPYASFHGLFPDIAEQETRSLILPLDEEDLPEGVYSLVEMFCDEEGCDCRRAFIQVFAVAGRLQSREPLATIAYGWEDAAYYRKWMGGPLSKPELDDLKGPALPILTAQSKYASPLLERVKIALQDKAYVQRIIQHYKLYRSEIQATSDHAPIRSDSKPGPNEPCVCGSQKKFKKCCGQYH